MSTGDVCVTATVPNSHKDSRSRPSVSPDNQQPTGSSAAEVAMHNSWPSHRWQQQPAYTIQFKVKKPAWYYAKSFRPKMMS